MSNTPELNTIKWCPKGQTLDPLTNQCVDEATYLASIYTNDDLGHDETQPTGKQPNPFLMSFLNPETINGLGQTAADIIAASKKPAPVTNNITNVQAPPEKKSISQNPTAIIGAVLGSLLLVMLIVFVMKKRKPQIPTSI